jgi:hypothetical protein
MNMIASSPLVVLRAKAWCGAVRRSKASPIPWLQYVIVAVLQNVSPRPPTDRPAAVRRCLEDSGNKGWFGKPRADAKTERPPRGPLPRACMSLTCARLTTCAPGPGRCPQRKPPTPRTRRQSRAWRVVNYCCSSPPPPSAAAFVRRRVRGERRTSMRTRLCDIQARCQCKTAFACKNESIINRGQSRPEKCRPARDSRRWWRWVRGRTGAVRPRPVGRIEKTRTVRWMRGPRLVVLNLHMPVHRLPLGTVASIGVSYNSILYSAPRSYELPNPVSMSMPITNPGTRPCDGLDQCEGPDRRRRDFSVLLAP